MDVLIIYLIGLILEEANTCQNPLSQAVFLHILPISVVIVTFGHGVTAADEALVGDTGRGGRSRTQPGREAAGGAGEGICALGAASPSQMKIFWIFRAPVLLSFPGVGWW